MANQVHGYPMQILIMSTMFLTVSTHNSLSKYTGNDLLQLSSSLVPGINQWETFLPPILLLTKFKYQGIRFHNVLVSFIELDQRGVTKFTTNQEVLKVSDFKNNARL